jgi:hypothetical protein
MKYLLKSMCLFQLCYCLEPDFLQTETSTKTKTLKHTKCWGKYDNLNDSYLAKCTEEKSSIKPYLPSFKTYCPSHDFNFGFGKQMFSETMLCICVTFIIIFIICLYLLF